MHCVELAQRRGTAVSVVLSVVNIISRIRGSLSVELRKALAIGYVIVATYEAWNYDETTVYDQATSE